MRWIPKKPSSPKDPHAPADRVYKQRTPAGRERPFMKLYCALAPLLTALVGTLVPSAVGQTRVAGHIGFVLPLVTHSDGATTTIADGFSIGFPTGITLKGPGRLAFDMEFVPSIQKSPRSVTLTVHPGFVEAVGHGFAVGVRAAFVVD